MANKRGLEAKVDAVDECKYLLQPIAEKYGLGFAKISPRLCVFYDTHLDDVLYEIKVALNDEITDNEMDLYIRYKGNQAPNKSLVREVQGLSG